MWSVRTAHGEVRSPNVVYCVSSLDRRLHQPTGRAVLPVATYVAVTEPLTQDVIRTRSAISDTRRAGNYYRLVDEGRLLWGGAITTRVSEPARLAERGDAMAAIDDHPGSLEPLLQMYADDIASGLTDMPYPPDYPKMPGEPPRVQPSRINPLNWANDEA